MRRWLHCMIVALLCATLFMDSARACWYLRHHRRGSVCPPATPPAPWHGSCPSWTLVAGPDASPAAWADAAPTWHGQIIERNGCRPVDAEGCAADAVTWVEGVLVSTDPLAGECCSSCAENAEQIIASDEGHVIDGHIIEHGLSVQGDVGHVVIAPSERDPAQPSPATGSVVVHDPTIVVGGPAGGGPAARDAMPEPAAAKPAAPQPRLAVEPLPTLKPATATAEQPMPASLDLPANDAAASADDDKAMPEKPAQPAVDELAAAPAPVAQAPTVEPREPNLFDELEDEVGDETDEPEMTEETVTEDAADPAEPGSDEAPGKEQPAAPADGEDSAPAATASLVPDEPMRRWTDATGDHHAQGWLAELHAETVRILKINGRYTTMAVADLSAADQDYVATVATRLAASRQPTATANDTAGL